MSERSDTLESVAVETLKCCLSWEPEARLIGNVRAFDLARLAVTHLTSCPACGADPGCDIDCALCAQIYALDMDGD